MKTSGRAPVRVMQGVGTAIFPDHRVRPCCYLWPVTELVRPKAPDFAGDLGVDGPHYAVLMYIHLEEGVSSTELARRLQVSPRTSRTWSLGWRAWAGWNDGLTRATGTCASSTSPKRAKPPGVLRTP